MPACQLKKFLRRGVQPGWQDNTGDGATAGGVVYHHYLELRVLLPLQPAQARPELLGPVLRAHDHADEWRLRQHLCPAAQEWPLVGNSAEPCPWQRLRAA